MKSLKRIFLEALKEQELQPEDDKVVSFPKQNFSVSFFEKEKKIFFSPLVGGMSSKLRSIIGKLKQNFKIVSVTPKEMGSFDVAVDPRENYPSIIDYIKNELDQE